MVILHVLIETNSTTFIIWCWWFMRVLNKFWYNTYSIKLIWSKCQVEKFGSPLFFILKISISRNYISPFLPRQRRWSDNLLCTAGWGLNTNYGWKWHSYRRNCLWNGTSVDAASYSSLYIHSQLYYRGICGLSELTNIREVTQPSSYIEASIIIFETSKTT